MPSRLREHFGSAGLVVAIVALVAALGGGAYAATGGSSGGKATASAKAKQGKQGKPGKTGPQGPAGPAGPAGPQGPAGPKGDAGAAGSNGTNGTNGANGASVTSTPIPTSSATCNHLGGTEFKVGTGAPTTACNGQTGFTETLPSGKTETGTWAVGQGGTGEVNFAAETSASTPLQLVPISFAIPLEVAPELVFVQMTEGPGAEPFADPTELKQLQEEGAAQGCPGIEAGVPLATPGKLCVYGSSLNHLTPPGTGLARTKLPANANDQVFTGGGTMPAEPGGSGPAAGVSAVGTSLTMTCTSVKCEGFGVWAVTAE